MVLWWGSIPHKGTMINMFHLNPIIMEFKSIIQMYLDSMASKDTEFAQCYSNEQKNIDECVLFIQHEMYQRAKDAAGKNHHSACVMPTDDEVFALAVRYYRDADLKVDGTSFDNVKVLSMAATSFSEEEKAQMREDAIKEYKENVIKEQKAKAAAEKAAKNAKASKPAAPIIVPDAPATRETPKTSHVPAKKQENKKDEPAKVVQLSLLF